MESLVFDLKNSTLWNGRGLLIGQKCAKKILFLSFVRFPTDIAQEVHADEVKRSLCGALEIIGVYDDCTLSSAEQRKLVWKIFGMRKHHVEDVYFCTRNDRKTLSFTRFWTGDDWNKESTPINANGVSGVKLSLITGRLSVLFDVPIVSGRSIAGRALEESANEFCDVIEKEVFVGDVSQKECPIWTRKKGPLSLIHRDEDADFILEGKGELVAVVAVNNDCTKDEISKFIIQDFQNSLRVRIAILLDEMEQMQEDSKNPEIEHALSRYKEVVGLETLRWTLPRRVLVQGEGSAIPFVDYQLMGEYEGKQTFLRAKETLGFESIKIHDLETTPVQPSFQLGAKGVENKKRGEPLKTVAANDKIGKIWLFSVIGSLLVLIVSIIVLRIM